jgi:hypothetical protein
MMRRGQEEAGVVAWRTQRLLRAGVQGAAAAVLAEDRCVDLHALLELLDRGCPPALAVRIVAPLDRELPGDSPPPR